MENAIANNKAEGYVMPEGYVAPAREHNDCIDNAQKLLETITHVEQRQGYWKQVLEDVFRVETEQDSLNKELTKTVALDEAESLMNVHFVTWMAGREGQGVGMEAVEEWYHDDELALSTPFAAMVPYPRRMTAEGAAFFVESVDDLFQSGGDGSAATQLFVRTMLPSLSFTTCCELLLGGGAKSASAVAANSKSSGSRRGYSWTVCSNGIDVHALCSHDEVLRAALETTPCVFLSTKPPDGVRAAKIIVVGGKLVAVQLDGTRSEEDEADFSQLLGDLCCFVYDSVIRKYPSRSVCALVALNAKRHWSLINVVPTTGLELECFDQQDLLTAAQVLHRAAKGVEGRTGEKLLPQEQRPLVRWFGDMATYADPTKSVHTLSADIRSAFSRRAETQVRTAEKDLPPEMQQLVNDLAVAETQCQNEAGDEVRAPLGKSEEKGKKSSYDPSVVMLCGVALGSALASAAAVALVLGRRK